MRLAEPKSTNTIHVNSLLLAHLNGKCKCFGHFVWLRNDMFWSCAIFAFTNFKLTIALDNQCPGIMFDSISYSDRVVDFLSIQSQQQHFGQSCAKLATNRLKTGSCLKPKSHTTEIITGQ